MDRGKERALLRTEDLRRLIGRLESQRDVIMDEVAQKQGELDAMEQVIKYAYEIILDVNKEEQAAEEKIIQEKKQRVLQEEGQKKAEKEKKATTSRKKKVEKKLDGLKNSTRTLEIQDRARAARVRGGKKSKQKPKDK